MFQIIAGDASTIVDIAVKDFGVEADSGPLQWVILREFDAN